MGQTVVEKIAQAHMAEGPKRPLRAGDFLSIRPKHVMTHDNTAAVLKKFKTIGVKQVYDTRQPVFALDHDIQNTSEQNLKQYLAIETFAKEQSIDFYPAGTGIGHQLMMEKGYVLPGSFVVASDSHSNMYGALGAIGTPVVRTDAAAIWATGEFWWQIPRTIQVGLASGKLRPGVSGKDVIITLCGLYNKEEVLNAVVEFTGDGVRGLTIEERMSIANMTTEWGALVGWFPADPQTFAFLRERRLALGSGADGRLVEGVLRGLEANPPAPDKHAVYAAKIKLELSTVTPHVSGPDTVQVMASVAEMAKKKVAIQKAYLLSCVNSRLEDLGAARRGSRREEGRAHGEILCGGSVERRANARGRKRLLEDAGRGWSDVPAPKLWAMHWVGRGTPRGRGGWNLGNEPELQGTDGIARCKVLPRIPGR